jgi:hypothetical protein
MSSKRGEGVSGEVVAEQFGAFDGVGGDLGVVPVLPDAVFSEVDQSGEADDCAGVFAAPVDDVGPCPAGAEAWLHRPFDVQDSFASGAPSSTASSPSLLVSGLRLPVLKTGGG